MSREVATGRRINGSEMFMPEKRRRPMERAAKGCIGGNPTSLVPLGFSPAPLVSALSGRAGLPGRSCPLRLRRGYLNMCAGLKLVLAVDHHLFARLQAVVDHGLVAFCL